MTFPGAPSAGRFTDGRDPAPRRGESGFQTADTQRAACPSGNAREPTKDTATRVMPASTASSEERSNGL